MTVTDFEVKHGDLVAATRGRSIWVLEDVAALRAQRTRSAATAIRSIENGIRFRSDRRWDYPALGKLPKAPYGAIISYWLAEEPKGQIELRITDASGRLVRKLDSVGLRIETANGWTLIAQWLGGETEIEPDSGYEDWKFSATLALVSKAIGWHRVSVRADWFDTDHYETSFPPQDTEFGSAWTIGYSYERSDHLSFAVEALRIKSDLSSRAWLGEPTNATEWQLQLQLRYTR